MKKLILIAGLTPLFCYSQNQLHLQFFGGFSNYSGDLQPKQFTMDQSRGAFGAGLSYELSAHVSVRGALTYGRIAGSDRFNKPSLRARNLSFESQIFESSLSVEYSLLDMNYHSFSPYIFGGVALFRFNPYTYDSVGAKVFLMGMGTEGQGMRSYPDRKPYKLIQFSLPVGGGIKFRINDNTVLGYEIGLRKTFTDYLDDVSTTYVDPVKLGVYRNAESVSISYRGDELKDGNANYPAEGTSRGNPKFKDLYYFSGFTLWIRILDDQGRFFGKGARMHNMQCPRRVF